MIQTETKAWDGRSSTLQNEMAIGTVAYTEQQRKADFAACPILADYIGTMLQDLQYSENEEACSDGREPRDAGTIYTLPAVTYDKCKRECVEWYAKNAADIEDALQYMPHERIGSTLYLVRTGTGISFTDDNREQCLQRLDNSADELRNFDSVEPYFGDDGFIYI